jgi:hypothetical protein
MRRIIVKREIDVYRNGLMFEKDNVAAIGREFAVGVGVTL